MVNVGPGSVTPEAHKAGNKDKCPRYQLRTLSRNWRMGGVEGMVRGVLGDRAQGWEYWDGCVGLR